ncbi:MAG: indolepyruvate ferredoxin oxidoreductase family protein [Rhodospirillales bacterium]
MTTNTADEKTPGGGLAPVSLSDKYDLSKDRVFINGFQALLRMCLLQARADAARGLNTAGYISGYRGSPLGGLDMTFTRGQALLESAGVVFQPGLNEDLAATAVWGTQQAELRGEGTRDGVFAVWYGKGPGVDRSGDVFRHANMAGASKNGGVLVLTGDDHTCESSTAAHQSEYALVDAMMPVLNPADISELIEFGLHGWALSRFSGLWCGLKCVKDTVESSAVLDARRIYREPAAPADFTPPEGGMNIRLNDDRLEQEARLHQFRLPAAQAYARANGLDRVIYDGGPKPRIGVVSAGKSWLDLMQALDELGVDKALAAELGFAVYKIGMTWPLEPEGAKAFCLGLDQVIVVEEKRGLIEDQLRAVLYGEAGAPEIIGKKDEAGKTLFQAEGALNPLQAAAAVGARIPGLGAHAGPAARLAEITARLNRARKTQSILRQPYFCAGCPHNTSTVTPEGGRSYAGIGCHWMAQFMDRGVGGSTHMGGEGANWIGESRFSKRGHVFQNIGDGTFNHSGLTAIRAAAAAGTSITFKILYNDAVAMTGGQANDGGFDVYAAAAETAAAGVENIAVVSAEPKRLNAGRLPRGATLHDRSELAAVQRDLAARPGVTALIYEQTCAAEKRRRRKRGVMEDPPTRVFINERVCDGCGDCGVQSNCVAILPSETVFGRKRRIDQSACNKDYSCLNGFCPSFVTVEGEKRAAGGGGLSVGGLDLSNIPEPALPALKSPYAVAVTGVGGTGVVTAAALLGMAAHLEGKGCGIIDMAGLAQKGGAVVSHLKIAAEPSDINAVRIAPGGADLILGCDLMVSAGGDITGLISKGRTRAVVNSHEMMTGEFTRNPDFTLPFHRMRRELADAAGENAVKFVNAPHIAEALLGDSIGANLFMTGAAYQLGLLPLGRAAVERAIELNGAAVMLNKTAFALGRLWAHDAARVEAAAPEAPETPGPDTALDDFIALLADDLRHYQNAAYAGRFRRLVSRVREKDTGPDEAMTRAAAQSAHKLMAYKDEYEVARLYSDGDFRRTLEARFETPKNIKVHLAPPGLTRTDPVTGIPKKRAFGPWVFTAFRALAEMKALRGGPFDVFGWTRERRTERALVTRFEKLMDEVPAGLGGAEYETAVKIAALPQMIRGFGHVKARNIKTFEAELAALRRAFTPGAGGAGGSDGAKGAPERGETQAA